MGKSTTTCHNFLELLLNAVPWTNIADNAASGPATQFYLALHTADPGAGGNQTTSEVAYTNYARVAVARTGAGWTISGASATLTSTVSFPVSGGGTDQAKFATLGMLASGAGIILYSGGLSPFVTCSIGVQPILGTASTVSEA